MAIAEEEAQELCNKVMKTTLYFYDNPNDGYEYTCPLCGRMTSFKRVDNFVTPLITEVNHNDDCIYWIAKSIMEGNPEEE